jgi:dissimilatory sulfite reductase (desulfoviridin) alpha/beta subunit
MREAASRDLNPFRPGRQNQLISILAPFFPELDRLLGLTLNWSDNAWLAADNLYQIAELSERFGPGLCFIQAPGRQVRLPGLDPDREDELWDSLPRLGTRRLEVKTQANPGRCPLWGPCRGQRANHADLLLDLAEELKKEIDDGFRVELAGCPQDCRLAMERADAGIVLAEDGLGLTIWIGGRHRFGHEPIPPESYRFFDLTEAWPTLDVVFKLHDLWYTHHLPDDETLPEMVRRLGLAFFSQSAREIALADELGWETASADVETPPNGPDPAESVAAARPSDDVSPEGPRPESSAAENVSIEGDRLDVAPDPAKDVDSFSPEDDRLDVAKDVDSFSPESDRLDVATDANGFSPKGDRPEPLPDDGFLAATAPVSSEPVEDLPIIDVQDEGAGDLADGNGQNPYPTFSVPAEGPQEEPHPAAGWTAVDPAEGFRSELSPAASESAEDVPIIDVQADGEGEPTEGPLANGGLAGYGQVDYGLADEGLAAVSLEVDSLAVEGLAIEALEIDGLDLKPTETCLGALDDYGHPALSLDPQAEAARDFAAEAVPLTLDQAMAPPVVDVMAEGEGESASRADLNGLAAEDPPEGDQGGPAPQGPSGEGQA